LQATGSAHGSITNRIADGLPAHARGRLLEQSESVDLVFGSTLSEHDRPFRHVYFPLSGFVSLMATVDRNHPLEVGIIGNEGMLGATLALGVDAAPQHCMVQGSGTALRMSAARFRVILGESPALQRTLGRYLYVLMAQISRTVACTHFHEVDARLARWLLMTHDRAHADGFYLTHKFLADMLGVQRSAVTIAAGTFQRQGLIRYTRGEITVMDRAGLEAASCECYAKTSAEYLRYFS
jgi:CRP-like cAMP-binding protein